MINLCTLMAIKVLLQRLVTYDFYYVKTIMVSVKGIIYPHNAPILPLVYLHHHGGKLPEVENWV